jgi:hypothetical protein
LSNTLLETIAYRDLKGLTSLNSLYLNSMPYLRFIDEYAFQDVVNLRDLKCENNFLLKEIHVRAFRNRMTNETLAGIRYLSFRHNALSTLSADALNWSTVSSLDLAMNPWKCDCKLKWIKEIEVTDEENLICDKPHRVAGTKLESLPTEDFVCPYFDTDFTVIGIVMIIIVTMMGVTTTCYVVVKLSLLSKICSCFYHRKHFPGGYVRVVPAEYHRGSVDLEWDTSAEPDHVIFNAL